MPTSATYPSPFTTPPDVRLQQLAREQMLPPDFVGRHGIALIRSSRTGEERVLSALEPVTRGLNDDWRQLKADDLWPAWPASRLPEKTLMTGLGDEMSLDGLLALIFEHYPVLAWDEGGRQWEQRKARWRFAVAQALKSPTVVLLDRVNRINHADRSAPWTLIGTAERWIGPSPAHEMRHHGTFIAPKRSTRYPVEVLLRGLPHETDRPIAQSSPTIPILYDDQSLVVIDKPARLASVPGVRETFSAKSVLESQIGPLRVVHRLDTDTSGLLVFAKTREAERRLQTSFRDGLVFKRYEARLEGVPKINRGRLNLPIALNALDRPLQCVLSPAAGGKPAATDWELKEIVTTAHGRAQAIVSLWPDTGRTHQLRVHCAHRDGLNCPIDGDSFYGSMGILAENGRTRLCLHASELTFVHPTTDRILSFSSEADFPIFF